MGVPHPPHSDPAYVGQSPSTAPYRPPTPNPGEFNPTEQWPYPWPAGQRPPDQQDTQPTPPGGRGKPPRWLWIAAAAAVLLVVALVVALVITDNSATKPSAVAPIPAMPSSTAATSSSTTAAPTTTSPSATTSPTATSTETTSAGAAAAVVYNVTGEGRAISITYVDSAGVVATEFNVALPWNKQVSLPASGGHRANVTIINVGHDVTCTITVNGAQVRERTGAGLTVCDATS
ncbi:MmpS family transport accessory protein [Mycobacterium sp.]